MPEELSYPQSAYDISAMIIMQQVLLDSDDYKLPLRLVASSRICNHNHHWHVLDEI